MTTHFSESAMLVSCNIKCYSAQREDKKITRDVAISHGVAQDAGKYKKVLVAKKYLEDITKASGALRAFVTEQSLPWLHDGVRIMPAQNYAFTKAGLIKLQDDYDRAANLFLSQWDSGEVKIDARARLGAMFKENDYPNNMRDKFGTKIRFMPIADENDFRTKVADDEREVIRAQIADTYKDAERAAMDDIYQRVAYAVQNMATRLNAYRKFTIDGKDKTEHAFRDSLVENLREVVLLIPRLNFTNDQRLEKLRVQITDELLGADADTLRDDDAVREDTAIRAEKIASDLSEFMA